MVSFVSAQMNATRCIGGQNKINLYSALEFLYAREGIRISNYGCKGSESFVDLQVLEGKFVIFR